MRNNKRERLKHHLGDALIWEVLQHVYHALERGWALGSNSQEKGSLACVVWVQDLEGKSPLCKRQLVILLLVVVPRVNLLDQL